MSSGRKETERTKLMQEKCQTLLTQMLRDEDNKYCVDCDAKGPRWASWNLGVFLCIRCAGIHRNLGVHISRVKSVNLDTWTPEQVISLQQMGNSRARAVYEAQLPDGFRRPQTDTALESFIRAKYEHKKYLAREWVPPSPPKVDWAKEIDDEIEKQKRKKKSAQNGSLGLVGLPNTIDKKTSAMTSSSANNKSPLPLPLPKPKSSNSPKTSRNSESSSSGMTDLLGLSSPTGVNSVSTSVASNNPGHANDSHNDSFTGFLSAPPLANGATNIQDNKLGGNTSSPGGVSGKVSLAKEEEDFFNQTSLVSDRDKSGKLTKDSILALYATGPQSSPQNSLGQFNNNPLVGFNNTFGGGGGGGGALQQSQQSFPAGLVQQQHQQQPPQPVSGLGALNIGIGLQQNQFGQGMNLAGMQPGLFGLPHHQQPQQQTQFMTPPNSATMYNAPVMTAPAAFTSAIGHHNPNQQMMGMHQSTGFAQFPPMQQQQQQQPQPAGLMSTGDGRAYGHGQPVQSMMSSQLFGMGHGQPRNINNAPEPMAMGRQANLSQQFGNLNIGNVWQ